MRTLAQHCWVCPCVHQQGAQGSGQGICGITGLGPAAHPRSPGESEKTGSKLETAGPAALWAPPSL